MLPLLLQKVLGLRLECFRIDVLHAVDLGVAAHIVGNILWESVVDHKWGAPTQDENLALLEADFRKWEKSQDVPHRGRLQGQLTKEPSCRLKF